MQLSDSVDGTVLLVDKVQASIQRLMGKVDSLQGRVADMHVRLGRVQAAPAASALFPGTPGPGGAAAASSFFDVEHLHL